MKLITRQTRANEAADRWQGRYSYSPSAQLTYDRLRSLGDNPDPDEVDSILGDEGAWTATPYCTECGVEGQSVVELGEPRDFESATVCLCKSCLTEALELLS